MQSPPTNILILDDNEVDAALISSAILHDLPDVRTHHASTSEEFESLLIAVRPDAIISDYQMPGFSGAAALALTKQHAPHTPFILVSGTLGDDEAVHLLKQGATDFLSKDRLYRLPDVIDRALLEMRDRVRATKALRESEERYRTVVESARELIYSTDRGGNFVYANPAVLRVTGYTLEELQRHNYLDLIVPDARVNVRRFYMRQLLEQQETSYIEIPLYSSTGEVLWFGQNSTIIIDNGIVTGFQVIARDITQQIRTDRQLAQSLSLLQAALDSTADGILVVNTEQGIETYNRKFLDIWQIPDDIAKTNSDQILLEFVTDKLRDPAAFRAEVSHLYECPGAVSFDVLDLRDGRRLERYSQPQYLEGKIVGRVWSFRDITQQYRSEEQLRTSHHQLRALTARLQSVREEESARIAREIHDELGQALTGLKMDLRWLEKRITPEPKLNERITAMSDLVGSTISLVRRIATELRPGILDSLGLVAAIEWQAQEFQARTGMRCQVISANPDMQFSSDQATALFRILQEALTNIIRHTKADTVTIEIGRDESATTLSIRDNGNGITAEKLNDPHSLGLLGMRERLMPIGGTLDIYGSPATGTTVRATIPTDIHG